MSCIIGFGPTKTRTISDVGYLSSIALQLTEKIFRKILSPEERYLAHSVQAPLSPNRFHRYLNESAKEIMLSRDDLIPVALKSVQSSFKSLRGGELTEREIIHNMELERGTPFESIPKEQREFSCFRYALDRVGIVFPKPIENPRVLKKILFDHFTLEEEPQEGDLVLFSSGGKPLHLGIYHQRQVLSKEGNGAHVAYMRPIEDFVAEYGESFQYFRRRREC